MGCKIMEYEWSIQFYISVLDNDDTDIYENPIKEIIIKASTIENAIKSAHQYISEKSIKFNEWQDAQIISIFKMGRVK